ncbi:hypothetical protein AMTRI_Chr02g219780 [Amborella trichopoda]
MANSPEDEIDDELFKEVYGKEYTGPPGSNARNMQENAKSNKRPQAAVNEVADSDEEMEPRDPNAVPTDFTSREAKAWEAKAKATERNWKKRKEEEMICKICGESGHFTQGCPSTLGSNRKSQEFVERVFIRDKHVKAYFSEKVVRNIEKDIGCKVKVEERFIVVSGKDRLCLAKGVDAVKKAMKEDDKGKNRGPSSSHRTRSRSPGASPVGSQVKRSVTPRSHSSPRNLSQIQQKNFSQEKVVEDHLRQDIKQLSRGSPQAYGYGNDGAKGRSGSPQRASYASHGFNPYDAHSQSMAVHKSDSWNVEGRGPEIDSSRKFEFRGYPQALEELELEFRREITELARTRDKEEDEENSKHRESINELRDTYMKKISMLRASHAKQWEEFLQKDAQMRQRSRQHMSSVSSYNNYPLPGGGGFSDYDRTVADNPHFAANAPLDARSRYHMPVDGYQNPRPVSGYGDYPRQRQEDYGKPYHRY